MTNELYIERVNQLIAETDKFFPTSERPDLALIDKTTFATFGLIQSLYANSETYTSAITKAREKYLHNHRAAFEAHQLMTCLRGILENIKFELENGFLTSLATQIEGEIFGD